MSQANQNAAPARRDHPFFKGVTPISLSRKNYFPYHKLGEPGRLFKELSHLADMTGAPSGKDLLVIHRANTEKIRKTGYHARVWKHYTPGFNRKLIETFGSPECIFEKRSTAHYIDESAYRLGVILRLARDYYTHVLVFDEKADDVRVYVSKTYAQARRDKRRDTDQTPESE